ncbi:MAG: T9SS type A sorting domain-containing protein [Bacteroidia bacterium]
MKQMLQYKINSIRSFSQTLFLSLGILFSPLLYSNLEAQNISTIAGNGIPGFSGDGSSATSAQLDSLSGVAIDAAGNIYIADNSNNRIRKVSPAGLITTIAGTGTGGYGGDGGPATSALLNFPNGIALDGAGNIYIADGSNNRVRKISPSGIINTIAGNGTAGFGGDGGPATTAQLNGPAAIAIDKTGNVYIADCTNQRIRKVDSSGTILTVAGNGTAGYGGDAGLATSAKLANPTGVAVDGSGNLYIADNYNHRIRFVNSAGIISTVAGSGVAGFAGDGAFAIHAKLRYPTGVALDKSGNIFIADLLNNRIRKVDTTGLITTVAGKGITGYSGDGGLATLAELNYPYSLTIDGTGSLFIADGGNNRVRMVSYTTGINERIPDIKVRIFPVPCSEHLNIQLNGAGYKQINIYDMNGKILYSSILDPGQHDRLAEINMQDAPSGVYLLHVEHDKGMVNARFTVMK